MDINWKCNGCGQPLITDSKYAGAEVECPKCKKSVPVPGNQALPEEKKKIIPKCPSCSAELEEGFVLCVHCGFNLQTGRKLTTVTRDVAAAAAPVGYAGFWRRFVAAIIDSIILVIGGAIIGGIVGAIIGGILGASGTDLGTIKAVAGVAGNIIGSVLNWLYFTLLESSSKQATLGKMAIGIVVTDLDGNRISFGRANGRYWSKIISSIILMIGFIMAGFTQRKQALHDIMARCLVLKK